IRVFHVTGVQSCALPIWLERMRAGDEPASNEITLRLAYALGTRHPTFAAPGFGLTLWEARVDRGVGMYLRPPAGLFRELGLDLRSEARRVGRGVERTVVP